MLDRRSILRNYLVILVALCCASAAAAQPNDAPTSDAAERFSFLVDGDERTVLGRVVVEAADGSLLVEADDGVQWTIEAGELVTREPTGEPFKPLAHDELAERLLAELPPGFRAHTTPHYVVCYNTSRAYALWTSSLLERLHKAFTNYWEHEGLEVREPRFPLPVLVFDDAQMYDDASREDLPNGTGVTNLAPGRAGRRVGIVGFYSLRSNRVNMFDLTGAERLRDEDDRRGSLREINRMLSQPAAVPLVATIVHEATHQIAFNCGLSRRYADIPLWLCEGMAVYFEAPDLTSTRGWRGIGRVNYPRLEKFHANLRTWKAGSLKGLVENDARFRNPQTAVAAYADAWALNYYLIKYRSKDYREYLRMLAAKRPFINDGPEQRLDEFREHFGDIDELEQAFLRQMARVR